MLRGLLEWVSGQGKAKKKQQKEFAEQVYKTFPTPGHANAAQNMYGVLDPSQGHGMNNAQWRWMQNKNITHPWQLKPNAFHDMLYSAEGMPQETQNAMWRDYYTMNNMPPALNTQKNIDILIQAADKDMSPY